MSRAVLEAVLDALPIGATLADARGEVLHANPAFADRSGLSADDVRGRSLLDVFPALRGERALVDAFGDGGHGAERTLVADVARAGDEAAPGSSLELLVCPFVADGLRLALVLLDASPSRGRVLRETRRLKHEMSNPLMGLLGSVELLLDSAELSPQALRRVETIRSEAARLKELLGELGRLGRDAG